MLAFSGKFQPRVCRGIFVPVCIGGGLKTHQTKMVYAVRGGGDNFRGMDCSKFGDLWAKRVQVVWKKLQNLSNSV